MISHGYITMVLAAEHNEERRRKAIFHIFFAAHWQASQAIACFLTGMWGVDRFSC